MKVIARRGRAALVDRMRNDYRAFIQGTLLAKRGYSAKPERAMGQSDLLARAAECESALQIAIDAEHRDVLQRLKAIWLTLARAHSVAEDPEMQEMIADLQALHAEITAARPSLH